MISLFIAFKVFWLWLTLPGCRFYQRMTRWGRILFHFVSLIPIKIFWKRHDLRRKLYRKAYQKSNIWKLQTICIGTKKKMCFKLNFEHFKLHYHMSRLNDILVRGIVLAAKICKKNHKNVIVRYSKNIKSHFSKSDISQVREIY